MTILQYEVLYVQSVYLCLVIVHVDFFVHTLVYTKGMGIEV